jgi:hypothetical protein
MKVREITVSLQAPDTSWSLHIRGMFQVKEELWVVAELAKEPDIMAAMMITTVSDTVSLKLPDLPVNVFVIGKTWNWDNDEEITFIDGWKEINPTIKEAQRLYPEPHYHPED